MKPPNYRRSNVTQNHCGNCGAFKLDQDGAGFCRMFQTDVSSVYTCDKWYSRRTVKIRPR